MGASPGNSRGRGRVGAVEDGAVGRVDGGGGDGDAAGLGCVCEGDPIVADAATHGAEDVGEGAGWCVEAAAGNGEVGGGGEPPDRNLNRSMHSDKVHGRSAGNCRLSCHHPKSAHMFPRCEHDAAHGKTLRHAVDAESASPIPILLAIEGIRCESGTIP